MKRIYCIPKLDQISDFIKFSKDYNAGFEYNDFFIPDILDDENKINEIISQYMAIDRDRSEDTLHGAFLDVTVNSSDSRIFSASDFRVRQSMDIAMKLGVKAIIFHTNYIPNFRLDSYRMGWLDLNESYWRKILGDYPKLSIYMENMFDEDPKLLKLLAKRMSDEPRFSICLDLAHAYISSTPVDIWVNELLPYVSHLHINDNMGKQDTHHPVGTGTFPWDLYQSIFESLDDKDFPTTLIEVRSYDDLMTSIDYLKVNGLHPY